MTIRVSESTLDVLEWRTFTDQLFKLCRGPLGQKLVEDLRPGLIDGPSQRQSAHAILETLALKADTSMQLPVGGVPDVSQILKRIPRSGAITVEDFANLIRFQKAAQGLHHFVKRYAPKAPVLTAELSGLDLIEEWTVRHFPLLDAQGQLVDSASEDLRALRSLIRDLHAQIKARLDDFLHNPKLAELLQDSYVTVRDSRYVIPIKANFRGRVPGIVHDVSNSEATFFIEPQEVVESNNQLKIAEIEMAHEIERILAEIVDTTKPWVGAFERNVSLIAKADFFAAAADFVGSWQGTGAVAEESDVLDLTGLVHPILLQSRIVTPADLAFKEALILTGPNTGGKTVLLKSLGLALCAAWSGLPVPAKKAKVPRDLTGLMADIGDDQNLEANLSTFSGHLKVLKSALEDSEPGDLVLIDEIATGTSPEEGQPLAQAFIEALLDNGVKVFVTTHYGGLKNFAMVNEHCRIASMTFDSKTRKPTYTVAMDVPGESSALEIAEQLGFSSKVITRARALKGEVNEELTLAVKKLEDARKNFAQKERDLEAQVQTATDREKKAQERILEYERLQKAGLSDQTRDLVKSLAQLRDELAVKVREAQAGDLKTGAASLFAKISDTGEVMREAGRGEGAFDPTIAPLEPHELKPDLVVEVEGFGLGTLVEAPKDFSKGAKTPVRAQVGDMQVSVTLSRIHRATDARIQQHKTGQASQKAARERKAKSDLQPKLSGQSRVCDVRGKTIEEAMRRIEGSLNELVFDPDGTVTIIHGHGSDRLKDAIRGYLQKERSDLKFRSGTWPGEGGDGVTLVERSLDH
jgi:DNA mismatch repair protein MutS2